MIGSNELPVDMIEDYIEFHKKFKFNLPEKYEHPGEHVAGMRMNFLLEELVETAKAAGFTLSVTNNGEGDSIKFITDDSLEIEPEEILDGLVDLQYVVFGTAAFFGLLGYHAGDEEGTIFEQAWVRVHEANMKKVPVKSANDSKRGTKFDAKKPEGWKKPDLKDLVQ